ncbi:hypothetical protein PRK78_004580 [Emydomyces testavorans]|uniref:Uncharacterized protein n=1 Tax=Emydomyces testavorans TaxID=2070801 RepID=A0AAF0IJW7_9EURO|nr:hypothetical protein PRK78_004580 [Emydomyces testavorans]
MFIMDGIASGFGLHGSAFLYVKLAVLASAIIGFILLIFVLNIRKPKADPNNSLISYATFFYANFLKPCGHSDSRGQKYALESFYKTQANIYDSTRKRLLRGREDMLRLLAAQLEFKMGQRKGQQKRLIWVDVSREKSQKYARDARGS